MLQCAIENNAESYDCTTAMITVVDILITAICYLVFNKVCAMHGLSMNSILIRFCDHGADVNLC